MGTWCHSQRSPYLKDLDIIDCNAVLYRSHKWVSGNWVLHPKLLLQHFVIISSVQRCITSILIYIYSNQSTHKTLSITMVEVGSLRCRVSWTIQAGSFQWWLSVCAQVFGQVLHFKASGPEMIYFKSKYLLLFLHILCFFLFFFFGSRFWWENYWKYRGPNCMLVKPALYKVHENRTPCTYLYKHTQF